MARQVVNPRAPRRVVCAQFAIVLGPQAHSGVNGGGRSPIIGRFGAFVTSGRVSSQRSGTEPPPLRYRAAERMDLVPLVGADNFR
jgi:hypothetical protein